MGSIRRASLGDVVNSRDDRVSMGAGCQVWDEPAAQQEVGVDLGLSQLAADHYDRRV
jgi:hypothetical protein